MRRDSRSSVRQVNLGAVDSSPRVNQTVTNQSARSRLGNKGQAYQTLASSLSNFFDKGAQLAMNQQNIETETEVRLQQQKAREAALEAYAEFSTFKTESWDPDQQDLGEEAQRIFTEKFGENLSGYSVFDQTLRESFDSMTRQDIVNGRVFQAQRRIKKATNDLSTSIAQSFADPKLRGNVSSEDVIGWKQQIQDIDKSMTDGEAFAYVFKNLYDGASAGGGSGVARFSHVLNNVPVDERGNTFAKLFPAQSRQLLVAATSEVLNKATIGTREFASQAANKADLLAGQSDVQGLIDLMGDISSHVSANGGEVALAPVRDRISKHLNAIYTREKTIKDIHDLGRDPSVVSALSNDDLNDHASTYLKRTGLHDLKSLDSNRLVELSGFLDNVQQGRGYLPESITSWFTSAVARADDPAVMENALVLADSLSPQARKELFKGNEYVSTVLNAYRDMKDSGVANAQTYIREFLEDPQLAQRYKDFSWDSYDYESFETLLDENPLSPFTGNAGDEIVSYLNAEGVIDDVDFRSDVRLTPAAADRIEKAMKLRVLLHEKTNGFASSSTIMDIRNTVVRELARDGLAARKVKAGGIISADEWVIDAYTPKPANWGGKDNYLSAYDDFGRQEIRAPHVNGEVTNPAGIRENPVQNLQMALDELPDYLEGFDSEIIGKEVPNDPTGAFMVHHQYDAGMPTVPFFMQPGYIYEINGQEIQIPEDPSPENLKGLAELLPKGVYPEVDEFGGGVNLLVYPHYRGMDDFKNLEALKAGPAEPKLPDLPEFNSL